MCITEELVSVYMCVYTHIWGRCEAVTQTLGKTFTVNAAACASTPWGEWISRHCTDNVGLGITDVQHTANRSAGRAASRLSVMLHKSTGIEFESTHKCPLRMHQFGSAARWQEAGIGGGAPAVVSACMRQKTGGGLQMWKCPGGPRRHTCPPVTFREGSKPREGILGLFGGWIIWWFVPQMGWDLGLGTPYATSCVWEPFT